MPEFEAGFPHHPNTPPTLAQWSTLLGALAEFLLPCYARPEVHRHELIIQFPELIGVLASEES